jgi:hypothetical protein
VHPCSCKLRLSRHDRSGEGTNTSASKRQRARKMERSCCITWHLRGRREQAGPHSMCFLASEIYSPISSLFFICTDWADVPILWGWLYTRSAEVLHQRSCIRGLRGLPGLPFLACHLTSCPHKESVSQSVTNQKDSHSLTHSLTLAKDRQPASLPACPLSSPRLAQYGLKCQVTSSLFFSVTLCLVCLSLSLSLCFSRHNPRNQSLCSSS